MRQLIILSMLVLGSLSVGAFADETTAAPTANTPQCSQVEVNGKTSTACFGLSDEQVQNLNVSVDANAAIAPEHCEDRCIRGDWHHCFEWRRVCW